MKPTYFVTAAVSALMLSVAAVSAQTAPATPDATGATAPDTTTMGIPAGLANDPIVLQVQEQLAAQGYTLMSVEKKMNGSYVFEAVSAAGVKREVIYDAATGNVMDTVDHGTDQMTNGMPGDDGNNGMEGQDDNGSDDNGSHDNNGSDDGGSNDNGSHDNNGSNDSGSNDNGSHDNNGSDNSGSNDNGSDNGVDNETGSDD